MPDFDANKPGKEEEAKESCDEDDRPLAFSRSKKRSPSSSSKTKKEELEGDKEEKPIKKEKKGAGKSNAKTSNVRKEEVDEEEDEKPIKKEGGKSSANPSAVKKKEFDDLEPLANGAKKKAGKSNEKPSKLKKEEAEDWGEEEEDQKKKNKKKKEDEKKVAGKVGKVGAGKVGPVQGKEKRERKVYDLPGQKHDPPDERDPLRIFYETLYEQVPSSEMAAMWMMEWGLLPEDEAKKVFENKLRKLGSPIKIVSVKKTAIVTQTASRTVSNAKKRKAAHKSSDTEDDDDDFILSKKKKLKVSR